MRVPRAPCSARPPRPRRRPPPQPAPSTHAATGSPAACAAGSSHTGQSTSSPHIPDHTGPGEECLLLVHIRQVVGQVHYRICTDCAQGVITAIAIDERFHSTGLGTRALSHLRSRHPGLAWRSTLNLRTTRDLLRRMRIPTITADTHCTHTPTLSDPTHASG